MLNIEVILTKEVISLKIFANKTMFAEFFSLPDTFFTCQSSFFCASASTNHSPLL